MTSSGPAVGVGLKPTNLGAHQERARSYSGIDRLSGAASRALLDALNGFVFILDAERRILFMGRTPPDRGLHRFVGQDFLNLVPIEQRQILRQAIDLSAADVPAQELEVQGVETRRWHRLRISSIKEHGALTGFCIHALDIEDTKTREAENAVLRSRLHTQRPTSEMPYDGSMGGEDTDESRRSKDIQRRLDLMADALPVMISYVDRDRRYRYNNAAYERWFGISRRELSGRRLEEVLGTEPYERIAFYVDAALRGERVTFETSIPFRQVDLRQVVAHYVPDFSAQGEVQGYYALIEDISAMRDAEANLRRREDELHQLHKMEALGRLAGGIAHEFNNLLNVIAASCNVLELSLRGSAEGQDIERIQRAAQRGSSLTRQLLSFSRGAQPAGATPIELDALTSDMKMLLERFLGSKVTVEDALNAHCRILGEAGQIQQILMNLAINANDAMPDGGILRIETSRVGLSPEKRGIHGLLSPGDYATLCVSDTGTGMDAEVLSQIFDPFFTTKPPELGTGLGLSTVYGIVQQLGGFIEVESAAGHGSTFRLFFPCHDGDQ